MTSHDNPKASTMTTSTQNSQLLFRMGSTNSEPVSRFATHSTKATPEHREDDRSAGLVEPFPVLPILVGWGDIRFCESQERHETEREEQAGRPKVVQYAQQVDLTAEFGSGAQRDRYRKATSNSRQDGVQHAIVVREQQHPDGEERPDEQASGFGVVIRADGPFELPMDGNAFVPGLQQRGQDDQQNGQRHAQDPDDLAELSVRVIGTGHLLARQPVCAVVRCVDLAPSPWMDSGSSCP